MRKKSFLRLALPILIIAIVFCAIFLNQTSVSAASCGGVETSIIECGDEESGIGAILKTVINIMSIGIGILAVIGITIVGIQYLTAGANEEQTRKAKRRLIEIVIGIIAYILLYALLQWLIPGSTDPDDIPYFEPVETPTISPDNGSGNSNGNSNGGNSSFVEDKTCTAKTDREYITDKVTGAITGYYINIPEGATNKTPIILYLAGGGEYSGNPCRLAGTTTTAGKLTCESSMIGSTKYLFSSNEVITIIPTTGYTGQGHDPWVQSDRLSSLNTLVTGGMGVNDYLKSCGGIGNRDKHIMGMSWGAGGTWAMVNSNPSLFKTATPIAGSLYDYSSKFNASNYKNTRIIAISDNGYTSAMEDIVKQIKNAAPKTDPILVKTPYSHDSITQQLDYNAIFKCILKEKCDNFGSNTTVTKP